MPLAAENQPIVFISSAECGVESAMESPESDYISQSEPILR
jgi:hypothetical protein